MLRSVPHPCILTANVAENQCIKLTNSLYVAHAHIKRMFILVSAAIQSYERYKYFECLNPDAMDGWRDDFMANKQQIKCECGANLVHEEGCMKCYSCGFGACE